MRYLKYMFYNVKLKVCIFYDHTDLVRRLSKFHHFQQ